jgi:hypothetical protein
VTRDDRPRDDQDIEAEDADDDLSDPDHPDHDLSEWAPYTTPIESRPWFTRRWVMLIVGVLVILGMILPFFMRGG